MLLLFVKEEYVVRSTSSSIKFCFICVLIFPLGLDFQGDGEAPSKGFL